MLFIPMNNISLFNSNYQTNCHYIIKALKLICNKCRCSYQFNYVLLNSKQYTCALKYKRTRITTMMWYKLNYFVAKHEKPYKTINIVKTPYYLDSV